MTHHTTISSRNRQAILLCAIFAFVFTASRLLGRFTPPFCALLDQPAWLSLEILRTLIALLDLPALSTSLFGEPSFVQHLPQLGTFLSPLLCALAA